MLRFEMEDIEAAMSAALECSGTITMDIATYNRMHAVLGWPVGQELPWGSVLIDPDVPTGVLEVRPTSKA